jgi:hypothetical protein
MILRSALFWDITQSGVVILYRRFGKTYRSHLQDSRNLSNTIYLFIYLFIYFQVLAEIQVCRIYTIHIPVKPVDLKYVHRLWTDV